jgi:hypothetical protein
MAPMLTSARVRTARVNSLVAVLLAVLLIPVIHAAAAPSEPAATSARLEVQALPDCTTREELAARVAARSRRIHFDDGGAAGPTVRAAIIPAPRGGAVAELVIVQPDGKASSRRLSAPSCAEATDAIALIIALTLDPMSASASAPATAAGGRPATPAPPPSASQTGPTPPSAASASPRTAPESPPARPLAPARPAEPTTRPDHQTPSPTPSADREPTVFASPPAPPVAARRRFGAGGAAQAIFGLVPGVLPGLGVYLVAALDREALWSPAVVVAGTHAWSNGLLETGGTAAFTLDALTLDACPLRLHLSPLEARACGTALYGRLTAVGSETYSPATSARPFAAAGGAVLLSLELGRFFELSGRVGASASLIRDSFAFAPAVFHRTAAVTFAAGLGLGVRFP